VTQLYTASWRALCEASTAGPLSVQPVRISRGTPKFWPHAATCPAIDALMPDGWMFGIKDLEKFGRCYRRKLHTIGLPRLRALLDAIDGDGRPLALACFEADPADCHRGPLGFPGWWAKQTGEQVADLSVLRGRGGTGALVYEIEPLSNGGHDPATGQNSDAVQSGRQPQLALDLGAERNP
jgi:hypothetical protein